MLKKAKISMSQDPAIRFKVSAFQSKSQPKDPNMGIKRPKRFKSFYPPCLLHNIDLLRLLYKKLIKRHNLDQCIKDDYFQIIFSNVLQQTSLKNSFS